MGLPIITTSYQWVNEFEKTKNANFYKLMPDLSNLNYSLIESFDFRTPNVDDYKWNHILQNSGIIDFLKNHC